MYNSKKRFALSVFWIVLGTTLLVLSIIGVLDEASYAGIGGMLILVGVLQFVKLIRYQTNPAYHVNIDTQLTDERIEFLRMKSWTWTGTGVILCEAVGSFVAMMFNNHTLQLALSYNVCAMLIVYLVSFAIVSRKY